MSEEPREAQTELRCASCNDRGALLVEGDQHATLEPCVCLARCNRCDGEGYVLVTDDRGYELLAPCPDCSRAREQIRLWSLAQVPARLSHATLDSYQPRTQSQLAALQRCREWVHGIRPGWTGMLLAGPTGSGKTHLAVAMVRHALARRMRCLVLRVSDLLAGFKSRYARDDMSAAEWRAQLCTVPLLLLDELAELRTDWERQTVGDVIEGRYNGRRTTLATTNLSPDAVPGMFGEAGARLVSRLVEMCPLVVVRGPDARRGDV